MGSVNCADDFCSGIQQITKRFAEAVAAVGHGEEAERVVRSGFLPTARDGVGGGSRGECAFEFVGGNEDIQGRAQINAEFFIRWRLCPWCSAERSVLLIIRL